MEGKIVSKEFMGCFFLYNKKIKNGIMQQKYKKSLTSVLVGDKIATIHNFKSQSHEGKE